MGKDRVVGNPESRNRGFSSLEEAGYNFFLALDLDGRD